METLYNAMELNRDGIYWSQLTVWDSAIRCFLAAWTSLDFGLLNGLDHQRPDAADRPLDDELSVLSLSLHEGLSLDASASASNPMVEAAIEAPMESDEPSPPYMSSLVVAFGLPAFSIQSVPTEDDMSPLPWNVLQPENRPSDDDMARGRYYKIFTVYNRAFEFNTVSDAVTMTTLEWLRCVSNLPIVLCFNGGLAQHLHADRHESADSYTMALIIYHETQDLIQSQVACQQYDPALDLLLIALYNNMGHCYESLGDDERAMACFDRFIVAMAGSKQLHCLVAQEDLFYCERLVLGLAVKGQPAAMA